MTTRGRAAANPDQHYADIAAGHGMVGSLRLMMEARSAGISLSLGLGLRTQETGIHGDGNVWGHDRTIFVGGHDAKHNKTYSSVTKASVLAYLPQRGARGDGGMQGAGPLQLTYFTFQDEAMRLGGLWLPRVNYRVGFTDLAHLIRMHGGDERRALAEYNGGASNPNWRYADSVLHYRDGWHRELVAK